MQFIPPAVNTKKDTLDMGLHIEISGALEKREWDAIATLAHLMGGTVLSSAVPAAIAPAPAPAPAPPPVAPVGGGPEVVMPAVVLDKDGLPWDARIHVGTKTTTKEGRWTSKRNLAEGFKEQIEAELRQIMAAAPPPPPPADNTTDAEIAAAFPPAGAPVPPPPATTAPPPPRPTPAPDTTAMGDTPFQAIMKKVLARQTAGTLTTEVVAQTAKLIGLNGITDLAHRPDLIPMFEASLPQ